MSFKQLAPLLAAIGTAVCLCAAVGVFPAAAPESNEPVQSVMAPVAPDMSLVQSGESVGTEAAPAPGPDVQIGQATVEGQPVEGAQSAQNAEQPIPPQSAPEVEAPVVPYDFTQPAPETEAVEKDYFADAAFVGDSRTDGFMIYSGVGCGDKFVSNGLSIFQLAEKKALTIDGEKYTLLEALARKQYKKVYLCLGVNELGVYNDQGFYQSYCKAIDAIRAIQPEAVIYIQGLIPLNEGVVAQTIKRDYLTNQHLRVYNDLMKKAAEEKQVVFLDLYSEFVDENNELPAEASRDGVHLLRDGYQKWLAYLKTHTVDYEALYPAIPVTPAPAPEIPQEGSVAL